MTTPRMTVDLSPRKIALRGALVAAAALLFGGVYNTVSPLGISWTDVVRLDHEADAKKLGLKEVSLQEMKAAAAPGSGFLIVDARPLADYDGGHLPGAISAPARELAESISMLRNAAGKGDKVVVYCSGMSCSDSLNLGKALREDGFKEVYVFMPGVEGWMKAGLELER